MYQFQYVLSAGWRLIRWIGLSDLWTSRVRTPVRFVKTGLAYCNIKVTHVINVSEVLPVETELPAMLTPVQKHRTPPRLKHHVRSILNRTTGNNYYLLSLSHLRPFVHRIRKNNTTRTYFYRFPAILRTVTSVEICWPACFTFVVVSANSMFANFPSFRYLMAVMWTPLPKCLRCFVNISSTAQIKETSGKHTAVLMYI